MKRKFLGLLAVLTITATTQAQGLVDGFFNEKGNISISASYINTKYDELYVGSTKTNPVPAHNEIKQNIYNLYGTFGITDNLTGVLSVPYISAKGDGVADPVNGETEVSGVQDINAFLKYRLLSTDIDGSRFDIFTAVGATIATGYEPNGILSIGSGSTNGEFDLGVHFQGKSGLFTTVSAGYSVRGKADNNFGEGGDFDVPDAVLFNGSIGYAASKFFLQGFVTVQSSTDGVDIGGPGFAGNFPETEVDYTVLGGSAYVPLSPNFGISGGYGTVVQGKNIGDTNYFSVGLTYNLSSNSMTK